MEAPMRCGTRVWYYECSVRSVRGVRSARVEPQYVGVGSFVVCTIIGTHLGFDAVVLAFLPLLILTLFVVANEAAAKAFALGAVAPAVNEVHLDGVARLKPLLLQDVALADRLVSGPFFLLIRQLGRVALVAARVVVAAARGVLPWDAEHRRLIVGSTVRHGACDRVCVWGGGGRRGGC